MARGDGDDHEGTMDRSIVIWSSDQVVEKGLCAPCRGLDISVDRFIVQDSRHSGVRFSPTNFRMVSSTSPTMLGTLKDILETCSQGCRFCNLIITSIQVSLSQVQSDSDQWPDIQRAACYLSWEIDGRRVVKAGRLEMGKSQEQDTVRGLTRRIHLRWDHQQLNDAYLVFVARERYLTTASDAQHVWGAESLFLGRRIAGRGNIQARLKSWLDLCREQHRGPCTARSRETRSKFLNLLSHSYFGVIDVLNMQLTELPFDEVGCVPPYAALSYVWGHNRSFTTTLENVNLLRMHGGLEKVTSRLPVVIRDAIDLVRRLGLQYLWIDALCIIQDSPRSWKLNAYNMDSIYGNADLTICAADGDDASAGLRAMWPSNYAIRQEMADCAPGVRLMVSRPPEMYIKASKWNSRAWTFQERLLSRRCLIFIDGRVYFQCRSTGMSEDIYADRGGAGWSLDLVDAPMQMFRQITERAFWVYMKVAELYSSRDLTKAKDILAAFSGITNLMEEHMQAPFIFGLPSSHFDLALLWQHSGAVERRKPRNAVEAQDYAGLEFPSWSWNGWMSAAITYNQDMVGECLDNTREWLQKHTWIRWYVRDGHGDLRPLWVGTGIEGGFGGAGNEDTVWREDQSEDTRWRGYSTLRTSGASISMHASKRSQIVERFDYSSSTSSSDSSLHSSLVTRAAIAGKRSRRSFRLLSDTSSSNGDSEDARGAEMLLSPLQPSTSEAFQNKYTLLPSRAGESDVGAPPTLPGSVQNINNTILDPHLPAIPGLPSASSEQMASVIDDLLAAFRLVLRPAVLILKFLGLLRLAAQLSQLKWVRYCPPIQAKLPPRGMMPPPPPGMIPTMDFATIPPPPSTLPPPPPRPADDTTVRRSLPVTGKSTAKVAFEELPRYRSPSVPRYRPRSSSHDPSRSRSPRGRPEDSVKGSERILEPTLRGSTNTDRIRANSLKRRYTQLLRDAEKPLGRKERPRRGSRYDEARRADLRTFSSRRGDYVDRISLPASVKVQLPDDYGLERDWSPSDSRSRNRSKNRSSYDHALFERGSRRGPEDFQPSYDDIFVPSEDIQPNQTEMNPKFHIYPKEYPYRVVIAPYDPRLNSSEYPLMPILQFWTWHTWLNVQVPLNAIRNRTKDSRNTGLTRCHIADENRDWCGTIVLDERLVTSARSARQEFIAISEAKRFNQEECEAWTYYIPKERDQSEWDLFYVMLIDRRNEKWERVGLGKVFKEAFMRTAKWKEIMLG